MILTLVRDGFTGPIYCTPRTAELAAIVLRDSARLQEEDTAYARRKGYSRHAQPEPLYDSADAERAIASMTPVPIGEPFEPVIDAVGVFHPAGHILGSATATITDSHGRTAVFSGDLGRTTHPLLHRSAQPLGAHTIVMESTYGDRDHSDVDLELDELAEAITRTVKRGGTVIIPAFAVDRTEVLLVALRRLQDQDRIPIVPIHVDSPMALAALKVYRRAIADSDPEIRTSVLAEGPGIIDMPNVHEATTPADSVVLNHGEPEASAALAHRIATELDLAAVVPEPGEHIRV